MIDAGHVHGLVVLAARIVLAGGLLVVALVALMVWRSDRTKLTC
jgi:hypothetical protein